MLKNVKDLTSDDFSEGLNTSPNIFRLSSKSSPSMIDVKINFDGSVQKRFGSNIQNTSPLTGKGQSGFNTDSNSTLTDNLIAYWKMDEPSGTRFDGFAGNHFLDDNSNAPSDAGGILGRAGNFVSETSHYLLKNNTSTLTTGDIDFSISQWFYLNSTSITKQRTLISKSDFSGPYGGVDSATVLHFPFETTLSNNSLYTHVVAVSGNVSINTTSQKFGDGCAEFDGSGDYLIVPDSDDWDFGSGDFTIDLQYQFATTSGQHSFVGRSTAATSGRSFVFSSSPTTTDGIRFTFSADGDNLVNLDGPWVPASNIWYHLAIVRSSDTFKIYIDGSSIASTSTSNFSIIDNQSSLAIGAETLTGGSPPDGFMDEVRITKGFARWTGDFAPPSKAYSKSTEKEYWVFIDTNNRVTFSVSSSGFVWDGQVSANSFGAVTTATWYQVVAWHDTGDTIGIALNNTADTASYSSGVRSGSSPLVVGGISNGVSSFMDGRIDETGFWKKILTDQNKIDLYNSGNSNRFNVGFEDFIFGSFDFGASNKRWAVFAAGTGLYASSDLGVNFTEFGTSQTATYTHFERSKAHLIVTSDAYDPVLKWDGSGGTFASILNVSAPTTRFSINHQGFLILLNSQARKRLFSYEDDSTQATGDWADGFDLPSSADDEITDGTVLRRNLYVSTRYKIYRLSFVGGNPDWQFTEVKSFGFVPRTVQKVTLKDIGEVIIGMAWDRSIRLFDGSEDRIISNNIARDNRMSDFYLDKVSVEGTGLTLSHSVLDDNEQAYRLCLAVGERSSQTTHLLNFDGQINAFYPSKNQPFQTMVMAESANKRFLLAGDRSSNVVLLNSGNLDFNVTPITDHYMSPFYFDKSPAASQKSHQMHLFLTPTSSGSLFYEECIDFSNIFKTREMVTLDNTTNVVQIHKQFDVPVGFNAYRYRLSSSGNTADPWQLNRSDLFVEPLGIGKNQ